MSTKHTQTPWLLKKRDGFGYRIEHPSQALVAQISQDPCAILDEDENEANAAFIVRACNNYEALLGACKKAMEECCDLIATDAGLALESAIASAEKG